MVSASPISAPARSVSAVICSSSRPIRSDSSRRSFSSRAVLASADARFSPSWATLILASVTAALALSAASRRLSSAPLRVSTASPWRDNRLGSRRLGRRQSLALGVGRAGDLLELELLGVEPGALAAQPIELGARAREVLLLGGDGEVAVVGLGLEAREGLGDPLELRARRHQPRGRGGQLALEGAALVSKLADLALLSEDPRGRPRASRRR